MELVAGLGSSLATDIAVAGIRTRPQWLLIDLRTGDDRRLFGKLALPEGMATPLADRPRLVPVLGGGTRLRSEGDALARLAAAIPGDHPDLAAVSVVHCQESPAALVVDWVEGEALSIALRPRPRPAHDRAELVSRAGRWLRFFHELSDGEPIAYEYPADVLEWLKVVADYLHPAPARWTSLIAAVAHAVEEHDGLRPQVALHHGDMAARNLMVRPDGRLVGIDAGVEWQAPRSHDLAVFLTDLRMRSSWRTQARIPGFISGYGFAPGETWTSLIFLGLALIDRYLGRLARIQGGEGDRLRRSIEGLRLDHMADVVRHRMEEASW